MKQVLSSFAHFLARAFEATKGWIRRHPWLSLTAVPVLALAAVIAYVAAMIPLTPDIADIRKFKAERASVVLSADGKELALFKRANRTWVKLADISPHVLAALIATEDRKFFEHRGLDLRRTLGAAMHSLGGDLQGGSTITQQLARNLYPEEIGRAPTLARKVKEAITAVKIESSYSKDEILETYLNTVPFLYNAFGIEMAARTYFDKPAGKLDPLESATLVGMLKGTSYYNPVLNPERAVQRRNTVLAQMVKHDKLEAAQFESLKSRPLGLEFERQEEDLGAAPHLSQQLRRWLVSWADREGYDIHADGLVVRTTIDSRLQNLATEAVARQGDKLQAAADNAWGKRAGANKKLVQEFVRETGAYREARASGLSDEPALRKVQADTGFVQALWKEKTRLQAAFLAIEPDTGHVKAWVGSRDFKQDQFDHVQQARRQPGSTFKPFVYGAAFEQGINPMETLIDQAVEIRIDERTVWKPTDVGESSGLPTTLRDGLIYSKNTITTQLMQRVGPSRVAQVAQAMGVRQSKLDAVPSLALGTSPVTLKEMVAAYGTIANSGAYVEPVLVTAIHDRGGAILEQFHAAPAQQGLSTAAAQTLLDVMRGVVDKGTGAGIRSRYGIQGDLAGKTGTTQDNTDGWFILMHPRLVGGAWVGFNDNRITMGDGWGQGSQNALHIVGDFFQQSIKAKVIDTQARFTAPRDTTPASPPLFDRMNEWFGGIFPNNPDAQTAVQTPAVAEAPPSGAPVIVSEPPTVAAPPQVLEAPARGPDTQWFPQRSRDYSSPGFAPAPERPPLVVRPGVPAFEERREAVELGAGSARPPLEPPGDYRPEPRYEPRPEYRHEPRPEYRPEYRPEPSPEYRPEPPSQPRPGSDGGVRILREVR